MKDLAVSALCACIAQALPDPDDTRVDPMKNQRAWQALSEIKSRVEKSDKSRTLSFDMTVPDLSESVCRSLLEIGCDVGITAALDEVLKAEGRTLPTEHVSNPFRRESTHMREAVDAVQAGYRDAQESCCTCATSPRCVVHGSQQERVQAIIEQNARARAAQESRARESMPEDDAFPVGAGGQAECTCPPGSPVHMSSCPAILGRPR